jgi:toxin YoeB
VKLVFSERAWSQYLHWQETDRAILRRLNGLIKEGLRHPFEGTGKPEPLKGELAGFWSRRVDREHRMVYRVRADTLEIAQCRHHYQGPADPACRS